MINSLCFLEDNQLFTLRNKGYALYMTNNFSMFRLVNIQELLVGEVAFALEVLDSHGTDGHVMRLQQWVRHMLLIHVSTWKGIEQEQLNGLGE